MDQLDLFSSLPQQPLPEKKVEKKVTSDVKDKSPEAVITLLEEPADTTLITELRSANLNSVITFDESAPLEIDIAAPDDKTITEVTPTETFENVRKPPAKRGRKPHKEMAAEVDLIEIPADDILFQKQYYSISEVAGWFRVNTSLLRFWEIEFDILKPRKNRKGDRLFRPEDVKNLELIYHLLRDRKFTLEGAKDYLKKNKKGADAQFQITQSLQKFKSFLLELKANLQ